MPITDSKPTYDNPQTHDPQNVQYAAPYPQQFEDDTIDQYELWNTLWNKKGLVIALTVIAALVSAGRNSISSRIRDIEYTYGGSPQAKNDGKTKRSKHDHASEPLRNPQGGNYGLDMIKKL